MQIIWVIVVILCVIMVLIWAGGFIKHNWLEILTSGGNPFLFAGMMGVKTVTEAVI